MTRLYRILRKPYARAPLNGEGAYRFGGRWSSPGTRLAYTAQHLSLAMIEYWIHIDPDDPPADLVVVTAEIPGSISTTRLSGKHLPSGWRETPPPPPLAASGDRFVDEGRAAVLIVPSALAPSEFNWLINPQHAEFAKIRVASIEPFRFDPRFFR